MNKNARKPQGFYNRILVYYTLLFVKAKEIKRILNFINRRQIDFISRKKYRS